MHSPLSSVSVSSARGKTWRSERTSERALTIVVYAWLGQALNDVFIERVTWDCLMAHGTRNITKGNEDTLQPSASLRRLVVGALIVGLVFKTDVTEEVEIERGRRRERIDVRGRCSMPRVVRRIVMATAGPMTVMMVMVTGRVVVARRVRTRMGSEVARGTGGSRSMCCRRRGRGG